MAKRRLPRVGTTKRFSTFLKGYPNRHAAAEVWGVQSIQLKRLEQGDGIGLLTAFKIADKLGVRVEDLFTYQQK